MTIAFIPANKDIEGNEGADKAVKKAMQLSLTYTPTWSTSDYIKHIKKEKEIISNTFTSSLK